MLTEDVSGILPLVNGGTNADNAANARTNLAVPKNDGTGASGTWHALPKRYHRVTARVY